MKLTPGRIDVRLLMKLVLKNIIHKFWEMHLANRRVKPCKDNSPKVILVQSLILGDKMLRTTEVSQSQWCNKWSKNIHQVPTWWFFVYLYIVKIGVIVSHNYHPLLYLCKFVDITYLLCVYQICDFFDYSPCKTHIV